MLRVIGFGENLGSGFPHILSAWNEKHWLKPQFIEQRDLLQVKLILSIKTKNVVKDSQKSSGTSAKSSGTRQKTSDKIIELIKNDPQITAPKIAVELGLSTRGVEKNLRQLREAGIVKRVGSPTFGGHWEIIE